MKQTAARANTLIAGAVLLLGLAFAVCTQHVWEDYWITFRASRNLAAGYGLVYTPGDRLHTFTSPLGVLLPAAFSWLTGNHSDNLVLWLFRLVSLGALAAGMVLLFRTLLSLQLRPVVCWFTVALLGLDAKILDFTINGMETGLLLFFLALTIHGLLVAGPRQALRLGIGWAGLMWTRPDSCVYIAVLGAGALFFLSGRAGGKSRTGWGKLLLGAGLICAALYVSWFLWAWWYYGTPVPHTIAAKGANKPPLSFDDLIADLLTFPLKLLTPFGSSLQFVFLPGYADFGGWPALLGVVSYALGVTAAFAWLVPGVRLHTRLFSLSFFLGNFFLTAVLKYYPPWYLPTLAVFGYLAIGCFFDDLAALAASRAPPDRTPGWFPYLRQAGFVFALGLVLGQAAVTVCVARQLQVQQVLIENGLRRPIGLWLHDHAQTSRDTVMLEPLGYIGYYSGLRMLDWPGLASREMVEARKRLGPRRQHQVALVLMPDWLVLRPTDVQTGWFLDPESLQKFYELVRVFDATDKIQATRWLPGRSYLQFDQTFLVFHRLPASSSKPAVTGTGE